MSVSEKLELKLTPAGQFRCRKPGAEEFCDAKVRPCFPLSSPTRWYSIHDDEGHELGLVESLTDLDGESRAALEQALASAGFLIKIVRIETIETEHDLRNWKVETTGGERRFQTRMGSWPRKLDDGGVLIQDVAEDLYLIPNLGELDERSRKILWAFSD